MVVSGHVGEGPAVHPLAAAVTRVPPAVVPSGGMHIQGLDDRFRTWDPAASFDR